MWHDLCGCVQSFRLGKLFSKRLNTSVTGAITQLQQHAAPQSWSLWTRVLWFTDARENQRCREMKKKMQKMFSWRHLLICPITSRVHDLELFILFGCRVNKLFFLFIHLFIQYLLFIYVLILLNLLYRFYSISVYFYFPTDYYFTQL